MDDYKRGFLEGLQAAVILGQGRWDAYFKDADDKTLTEEDQEAAFNCTCAIGQFVSSLKELAASVHKGTMDPHKIAEANKPNYWWATEDGKGIN